MSDSVSGILLMVKGGMRFTFPPYELRAGALIQRPLSGKKSDNQNKLLMAN